MDCVSSRSKLLLELCANHDLDQVNSQRQERPRPNTKVLGLLDFYNADIEALAARNSIENSVCEFQKEISCYSYSSCKISSVSSSNKLPDESGFDVNRRMTKGLISISKGHCALEQLCLVMNMNPMSKGLFWKTSKQLH